MKAIAMSLNLASYGLTFWAGGAFTVAVTIIDRTGGLTPNELMQALGWPVAFVVWLLQ